ncbi:MAG TPA: UDP-glucose 4-epimerase GalE [Clostridiales bacterium]|nr:UDP-glucose 4-epimerase GalE [Clostridiales bacterium]
MNVLVTGGTGYIGSHTCVELIQAGMNVFVLDNLSNSSSLVLNRINEITGVNPDFVQLDLLDETGLDQYFSKNRFDAVIHFAGLKAVGESVKVPLRYYHNNVTGTLILLQIMQKYELKRIVFSSSATVYGMPDKMPISEDFPLGAINPYGRTKLMIEDILRDLYQSDPGWGISLLRYFNPVGAHPSGRMGEDPSGIPNNLMPYISQVAVGRREKLTVYGNDYPTLDGTGIRDYIHVTDLARGHVTALKKVLGGSGVEAYNLGTGKGYSVLEIIRAFEKASGVVIPYTISERRPGDAAVCYSDPSRAWRELSWKAERGIEEMCADTWRWQVNNPCGYVSAENTI